MKRQNSIGLFFAVGMMTFALGLGAGAFFAEREKSEPDDRSNPVEEALPVSFVGECIQEDTKYFVQRKSLNDGSVVRKETPIPKGYLGLDRKALIYQLKSQAESGALEKHIVDVSLVSFSKERVVVEEVYLEPEAEQSFYMTVSDSRLIVLYADRETVYMETGIMLDMVPEEMQADIIKGRKISSYEELIELLEAFSS